MSLGQFGTTDENKRVVRRLMQELFSVGRIEVADELIAEGYVEHAPLPGQEPGLRGLKEALPRFWAAFPDFRLSVDDMIADDKTHLENRFGVGTDHLEQIVELRQWGSGGPGGPSSAGRVKVKIPG